MINKENKSKVFLSIIAILVVANIIMIALFLQKKEEPVKQSYRQNKKAYITAFLQKDIGFNQQQLQQFDTLSNHHQERTRGMYEKIKGNKEEQFKQLVAGNFTDSTINAIAEQSATAQKAMEVMSFNHLKNIRLICKPGQLQKFDAMFGKVLNRRGDGKKKNDSK